MTENVIIIIHWLNGDIFQNFIITMEKLKQFVYDRFHKLGAIFRDKREEMSLGRCRVRQLQMLATSDV